MKELFGKKWILHIALALCLVLAFVPVITHYASAGTAVASVTIGDTTTEYDSLDAAVQAVANCTAEDKAVIKLLQNVNLYNHQIVNSGVFTLDLNGMYMSSEMNAVLKLNGEGVNVTIMDSDEGGTIAVTGYKRGVIVSSHGVLTINGGTIKGGNYAGVQASDYSSVVINDGTVASNNGNGVYVENNSTVTINGGDVIAGYGSSVGASNNSTVNITGGTIVGYSYGVYADGNCTVNMSGGIIMPCDIIHSGDNNGIHITNNCTLHISGGSIQANNKINYGVFAFTGSNVTISGGSVDGTQSGVYASGGSVLLISGGSVSSAREAVNGFYSTVTISGGRISGAYEISGSNSSVTLTVGENGIGATFVDGISVFKTTLDAILDENVSYWQNGEKVSVVDGQTQITGGDVTIMGACRHEKQNYTNNGEDHTFTCATCGKEITEPHSYDETTLLCPCGAVSTDAVALVSKNGIPTSAYITLNDAILAVAECTAEDEAVVKILQNIELGKEILWVYGGVFTLDLNGQQISSENEHGIILSGEEIVVTILDSGEGGSINSTAGICLKVFKADLIVDSGNIIGLTHGIYAANNGSITVNGGSIVGGNYGVMCDSGDITITGGNIESGGSGVSCGSGDVTITGGNIIADSHTVYCSGSNVNITDGIFTGDEGIYITEGQLAISGGQIDSDGYGVTARKGSTVTMSGGSIWAEQCGIYVNDSTLFISGGSIVCNKVTYTGSGISIERSAVTITGGTIVGVTTGINIREGTLTMEGGTVSGNDGVNAEGGTITVSGGYITAVNGFGIDASACRTNGTRIGSNLNVSGGTIVATNVGVAIYEQGSTCVISGGTIESDNVGVLAQQGAMIISGGSIYGKWSDIRDFENTVVLTWGKNGVGATFPGGIDVDYTTLAALLDEATGYWQCTGFVEVTEEQTEILGCDVMVMNVNVTFGIKGDLDGDGDVDAEDLTILARYVAGIITDWEEDED